MVEGKRSPSARIDLKTKKTKDVFRTLGRKIRGLIKKSAIIKLKTKRYPIFPDTYDTIKVQQRDIDDTHKPKTILKNITDWEQNTRTTFALVIIGGDAMMEICTKTDNGIMSENIIFDAEDGDIIIVKGNPSKITIIEGTSREKNNRWIEEEQGERRKKRNLLLIYKKGDAKQLMEERSEKLGVDGGYE